MRLPDGPSSTERRAPRLAIAAAVAADGGGLSDFAKAAGVSLSAATNWIKEWDPHLHAKLKESPRSYETEAEAAFARLCAVRDGRAAGLSDRSIAKQLKLSPAGLCKWLKRWAPDGVANAIADLEPEPEFEEAA